MDGKVLNIDKLLGKTKQRIYKVGVELEGGWAKLPEGMTIIRDGSVFISSGSLSSPLQVGELPSEILEPSQVPTWMKACYPSHVNKTCGLHVHMSFKRALYYQWLMTPDYLTTMVEYVRRWAKDEGLGSSHHIWERIRGENQFCKHEFLADMQVLRKSKSYDHNASGHRYTSINYCYGFHQTVECRLLPMMDTAEQGVRAVQAVLDITNACLVAIARREEKLKGTVDLSQDNISDENHVEYI